MGRYRNETLKVMLTKKEKEEIERKAELAEMTLSEFARIALSVNPIVNLDGHSVKQLCYEINRIGNNINQIAKQLNKNGNAYKNDIDDIIKKMDILNLLLSLLIQNHSVSDGEVV